MIAFVSNESASSHLGGNVTETSISTAKFVNFQGIEKVCKMCARNSCGSLIYLSTMHISKHSFAAIEGKKNIVLGKLLFISERKQKKIQKTIW